MLEQILGDDFVPIQKVYEEASKVGMKKSEIKAEKRNAGAKTLQVEKDGELLWLWYLPEKIWEKYHE